MPGDQTVVHHRKQTGSAVSATDAHDGLDLAVVEHPVEVGHPFFVRSGQVAVRLQDVLPLDRPVPEPLQIRDPFLMRAGSAMRLAGEMMPMRSPAFNLGGFRGSTGSPFGRGNKHKIQSVRGKCKAPIRFPLTLRTRCIYVANHHAPLNQCSRPLRLRYNVLLETLSDEEFPPVRDKFTERTFRPEEVIIEDEGYGDEVHFLVEGRVRISKKIPGTDDQLLALLHPGDCFGELELIAGRPRSARVVALDTLRHVHPAPDGLRAPALSFARLAVRLLQVLSIRLRATNNRFVLESSRAQ